MIAGMIQFIHHNDGETPHIPEFEFDVAKSQANLEKHGIDFEAARAIWADPTRAEVPARTGPEARYVVVGRVGGTHWTAVVTYRGERVRIISVRRSRPNEIEAYGHPQ